MTTGASRMPALRPGTGVHEPGPFYAFLQAFPRYLWPLFGRLTAEGQEHIPATGPFLLLTNHQSILDPFLIQTCIHRACHPMAKSTQFNSRLSAFIMTNSFAFPIRRFQVDAMAVRTTLRRLAAGHAVHIYIEGERTWDGALRPPRPGTVRIALKAGVPILPCVIDGAYDVWPRWASRPRRGDVRVAIGEPFRLPRIDDRAEREAALPDAADRIMSELSRLLGGVPFPGLADSPR